MHRTDKYSEHSSIIWPVWPNGWMFVYELSGSGFEFSSSHLSFNFAPASRKGFLDIQATIQCGFRLKCVRDIKRIYNQMHRTDKHSEHSWIIWPVWPNGWVLVYELSGSGFESSCSHLSFNFAPASRKEFLDIQATIQCGFTPKCVRDMTRTYSQMHHTDRYSEHSWIIWPVWPNGWVFVY